LLDHELNSEEEDLLEELDSQSDGSDEDHGPSFDHFWLAVLTLSSDSDVAFQPVSITEKVHQWQVAAQ
jgi:hypothetical protein